jgi:hypothetical protein
MLIHGAGSETGGGIYTVQLEEAFVKSFPGALGDLPEGRLRIQMFHGIAQPRHRGPGLPRCEQERAK